LVRPFFEVTLPLDDDPPDEAPPLAEPMEVLPRADPLPLAE